MHCFALFGTFKPLEKALGALITHLHVVDFHESSAKLSTATCLYPLNCIRLHRFGKLNYLVGRPFFKGKLLLLKASRTASEIIKIANSWLYEHIIFSMLCKYALKSPVFLFRGAEPISRIVRRLFFNQLLATCLHQ
jgi:hypothetical protein